MREHAAWNVDTHIRRRDRPDERGDALLHLARGLVGERDREDLERRHVELADQVGEPVGEHPGLARTRARDHEHRPGRQRDGLVLGRVQAREVERRPRRRRLRSLGFGDIRRRMSTTTDPSYRPAATANLHGCRPRRSSRALQSSSRRVTGPSFTSADLHLGPESAGRDRDAGGRDRGRERLDQRLREFGRRGGRPARPAAAGGVAVERELADDERGAAGVEQRRFITPSASSKMRRFATLPASLAAISLVSVCVAPDEHAEAGADLAHDLVTDRHPGLGDPLHQRAHRRTLRSRLSRVWRRLDTSCPLRSKHVRSAGGALGVGGPRTRAREAVHVRAVQERRLARAALASSPFHALSAAACSARP